MKSLLLFLVASLILPACFARNSLCASFPYTNNNVYQNTLLEGYCIFDPAEAYSVNMLLSASVPANSSITFMFVLPELFPNGDSITMQNLASSQQYYTPKYDIAPCDFPEMVGGRFNFSLIATNVECYDDPENKCYDTRDITAQVTPSMFANDAS